MAKVIRQERIRRGWSCEHVARLIGVTDETVRLIETGGRSPSYDVLVKLEDLFGMSHRELFAKAPDGQCRVGSSERPTR